MPGIQSQESNVLWEEFHTHRTLNVKHRIARKYAGMVPLILKIMDLRNAPPLDEQDLLQIGYLGLDDAIEKFDPTRGMKFETYAKFRIRGTILDELRRIDWIPRTIREHVANYRRAEELLLQKNGDVHRAEILEHLLAEGVAVDQIWSVNKAHNMSSLQELIFASEGDALTAEDRLASEDDDVLTLLIRDEMRGEILRIMRTLPEPHRMVLEFHYYKNVAFQDISELLGISGGRVSQLHKSAIMQMKEKLRDIMN